MSSPHKKVVHYIEQYHLIEHGSTIVLGLSGGPDSIYLLHLLASLREPLDMRLVAAHLDHQWRPDSWKDVELCKAACELLDVPLIIGKASDFQHMVSYKGSQEEYGRALRRTFLQTVATQHEADRIALAHHSDDQEETFFIRLIRGTTLSGLIGMRSHLGMYIRPLLEIPKSDILAYLDKHGIKYIHDSTNESDHYLRNRLRQTVLPALHAVDDRFSMHFARTLHHLQDAEALLIHYTQETLKNISSPDHTINQKAFLSLHSALQKRVLMLWLIDQGLPFIPQETFLDEILRFIKHGKAPYHELHQTWALCQKDGWLSIEKKA